MIFRLNEQADMVKKEIEEFDQLRIWKMRDIKSNEKEIKKMIKDMWYNVLSYHPDTFKAPKRKHEFSILTSNQPSSLLEDSKKASKNFYDSRRISFKETPKPETPKNRMSRSMSKPFGKYLPLFDFIPDQI